MSDFQKGLAFTAIPLIVLIVVSWSGTNNSYGGVSWTVTGLAFLAAFIAAIEESVRGKRRTSAGIFVGIAIGIVMAGISCFAITFGSI
jgi:hypothetical protein